MTAPKIDLRRPLGALASLAHVVTSDWLAIEPPPREYLLTDMRTGKGALASRGATLLVSAGGVGKSFSSLWLVATVATGGSPWLGCLSAVSPGRALMVSAEDDVDEVRRRLFYVARSLGLAELPRGAIEVLDLHARHFPLFDREGARTPHAAELLEHVKQRGPFALVTVDPIGRVAGGNIDADNDAAGALLAYFGELGAVAQGAVVAMHHTDKIARRQRIHDATAARGATGLGDYSRAVIVAHIDELKHEDESAAKHLSEIVTFAMRKSNYTSKWAPIELRRGPHGELVPLDTMDRELVAQARRRAAAGTSTETEQAKTEVREKKATAKDVARRKRDDDDDAAVRAAKVAAPSAAARDLKAMVMKARACGSARAWDAVRRVQVQGSVPAVPVPHGSPPVTPPPGTGTGNGRSRGVPGNGQEQQEQQEREVTP